MTRSILLGVSFIALSACVTTPEGGTRLPSRTAPVSFTGFSDTANADVVLTARNFRTGLFEELARTRSGGTETFTENQFGDHPALFPWSITVPIASTSQQLAERFKLSPCGGTEVVDRGVGDGPSGEDTSTTTTTSGCQVVFDAEVVVRVGDPLWVFEKGGVSCVTGRIGAGDDLLVASLECSPAGGEPLRLKSLP